MKWFGVILGTVMAAIGVYEFQRISPTYAFCHSALGGLTQAVSAKATQGCTNVTDNYDFMIVLMIAGFILTVWNARGLQRERKGVRFPE